MTQDQILRRIIELENEFLTLRNQQRAYQIDLSEEFDYFLKEIKHIREQIYNLMKLNKKQA